MTILSLGLDSAVLDPQSRVAERLRDYGNLVQRYTVLVPVRKAADFSLSERVRVIGVAGANRLGQWLGLYRQARRILKTEGCDLLTVQDQYYLAFLACCLARWAKRPLEIQIHGFEKNFWWRRFLARFVMRCAAGIRVVSERLKTDLIENWGVAAEKIVVIPIGVEIPAGLQPKLNYDAGQTFSLLFVGRLVSVKNIALQLRALAQIKELNFELNLVGSGPLEEPLRQLASRLGLAERVNFLGQITVAAHLESLYQAADAFILSSDSEGWGLAVIEAALHGLPIIMTNVGLAGEVIKNEHNGLVVPVGDTAALAAAIKRLMVDIDLRARLGQAARETVLRLPTGPETRRFCRDFWDRLLLDFS